MSHDFSDEELSGKRICHACISDAYLARAVEAEAQLGCCDYCGDDAATLSVGELAQRIEVAFDNHFVRTSDQPDDWQLRFLADRESDYSWDREGEPVLEAIAGAAGIVRHAAEDVLSLLEEQHADFEAAIIGEECEFSSDACYAERHVDDQQWQDEWDEFEHLLKTQARFFNHKAHDHLAKVFGGIDGLATRDGRPLVVGGGPGTGIQKLVRARVFQNEDQLREALGRPDQSFGPPPSKAARSGRMSAQGVSVFYGATHLDVALAEVRAPVGSRVGIATFRLIRPVRLLDLTALSGVLERGSVFDPSFKTRLERAAFLRTLGRRMARPVMPDDEGLDYLPTQAVADFLATMNHPHLDGIIFPSVQSKAGHNVVLFHHASRVVTMDLPPGTEVEATTGRFGEDGWEEDYDVWETVPAKPSEALPEEDDDLWHVETRPWASDARVGTLAVEPETMQVHYVEAVEVKTISHDVSRYRSTKTEPEF